MNNINSTESTNSTDTEERWDKIGGWASSACAVHCLISPLLFLSIPAFAEIWAHPASHALMAIGVVPLALTVVIFGYQKHRSKWVLYSALVGILFILFGSALPYIPETAEANFSDPLDAVAANEPCDCCPSIVTDTDGAMKLHWPPAGVATVAGSGFLIAAHWGNRRCSKRCCKNETGTCQNSDE
ncbi:MAG: MerC domain-containing protein [Planctomycetota bacterium]|nr:MerC domain-containing protein [Planctomycetota bacterium]